MKVLIEDAKEDDVEVLVHQQDDDSDVFVEEYGFNSCIRTMRVTNLTLSVDRAQLIVRCTLEHREQLND